MNGKLSTAVAERWKANPPSPMVIAVAVVELALKVFALVVLARTPRERVRMGRRWPWALIITLINTFGSVAFLVAGRKPAPAGQAGADAVEFGDDAL